MYSLHVAAVAHERDQKGVNFITVRQIQDAESMGNCQKTFRQLCIRGTIEVADDGNRRLAVFDESRG